MTTEQRQIKDLVDAYEAARTIWEADRCYPNEFKVLDARSALVEALKGGKMAVVNGKGYSAPNAPYLMVSSDVVIVPHDPVGMKPVRTEPVKITIKPLDPADPLNDVLSAMAGGRRMD